MHTSLHRKFFKAVHYVPIMESTSGFPRLPSPLLRLRIQANLKLYFTDHLQADENVESYECSILSVRSKHGLKGKMLRLSCPRQRVTHWADAHSQVEQEIPFHPQSHPPSFPAAGWLHLLRCLSPHCPNPCNKKEFYYIPGLSRARAAMAGRTGWSDRRKEQT